MSGVVPLAIRRNQHWRNKMSKIGSQLAMGLVLFASLSCGEGGDAPDNTVLPTEGAGEMNEHAGEPAGADHGGAQAEHSQADAEGTALVEAWAALRAARDGIAADIASGALDQVHPKAEPLPLLAQRVLDLSTDLEPEKRVRVEGAVKQVARIADALHEVADRGDAKRSAEELARLDGLLELIAAQYPAGALEASGAGALRAGGGHDSAMHDHKAMSALPGHQHKTRSLAAVDAKAEATVVVKASEFAFEPRTLELRAGVPTRIELDNREAAVEHSLLVRAPSGGDLIHLHAAANGTDADTFRIDTPGSYKVLCTIPGHTEAGMVGKLVVAAR